MKQLMRTDKNGTKYYLHTERCGKCGGAGVIPHYFFNEGGLCFDCEGSGVVEWEEKEYTPEYAAKLEAQRQKRFEKKKAEAMAHAAERNAEFFEKNGFNPEGKTYFVLGNTYDIKEQLKTQGAKWDNASSHWHMAVKPEGLKTLELSVEDIYDSDYAGIYHWNSWKRFDWDDKEVMKNCYITKLQEAEEKLSSELSTSDYVGEVGEKVDATLTYVGSASWVQQAFQSWRGEETMYLHKFADSQGNLFTWKTTSGLNLEENTTVSLKGTIKDHTEYKGIKQTVLTRCKIA